MEETSWEKVSDWYGRISGKEGHYYHQHVILPRSLELLNLQPGSSLLDLACGQGVLAQQIARDVLYQGVDISPSLINQAKRLDRNPKHAYLVADVTGKLPISKQDFSHASSILSLQNIANPAGVIKNARQHLKPGGKFLIVLNHPCFRIPRQSSWGIDPQNKIQYRRIDRYLTPLKVPITANPGQEKSEITWTFHFPLSYYTDVLGQHNFVIEKLEEWISDKQSVGKAAKMENRARKEFPMFMSILAKKE